MPGIGIMMPVYLVFKALGLIDTQLGLVIVFALLNLPIMVWMLYSYVPSDQVGRGGVSSWAMLI